jgi:hypothetical protein
MDPIHSNIKPGFQDVLREISQISQIRKRYKWSGVTWSNVVKLYIYHNNLFTRWTGSPKVVWDPLGARALRNSRKSCGLWASAPEKFCG